MKRTILILIASALITTLAVAQPAETSKLSTFVRHALKDYHSQTPTRGGDDQAPHHILAFIKVNGGTELLQKYGCQTYAQWGDIHIARIPLSNLASLSAETQVERIEAQASHANISTLQRLSSIPCPSMNPPPSTRLIQVKES